MSATICGLINLSFCWLYLIVGRLKPEKLIALCVLWGTLESSWMMWISYSGCLCRTDCPISRVVFVKLFWKVSKRWNVHMTWLSLKFTCPHHFLFVSCRGSQTKYAVLKTANFSGMKVHVKMQINMQMFLVWRFTSPTTHTYTNPSIVTYKKCIGHEKSSVWSFGVGEKIMKKIQLCL